VTSEQTAEETVAQLAELYLGNILYAIELAAMSLESQGRRDDAAFYRGIARKLAEAHGKARGEGRGRGPAGGGRATAGGSPEALSGGAY
jgi:hypothetical protein